MTTTESFETLMPEPAVRAVYATAKNTPAVKSGAEMSGYMKSPDYYTAAQMRAMFDAATERAAKQERKSVQGALRHAGLMLVRTEHGLQVMAAITDAQSESAAIRAREDGVTG